MTLLLLVALTHPSMEEIDFVPDFASMTMRQALRLHNKRVTLLIATEDPDNEDEDAECLGDDGASRTVCFRAGEVTTSGRVTGVLRVIVHKRRGGFEGFTEYRLDDATR